jgi:hypothetical protein
VTRTRAYITNSLASSTQLSYASALKSYLRFCTHERLSAPYTWPATPDTICMWMTAMATRDPPLQHGTIKRYLGALNTAHEVVGLPAPTRGDRATPLVERTYRGIKREQGSRDKRVRRPITTTLLRQMQPLLDHSLYLDRLVWAAMCTATCALLRLGELTVDPHHAARRTLRLQDLTFVTTAGIHLPASAPPAVLSALQPACTSAPPTIDTLDHAILFVPASKTDPFSKGASIIIASSLATSALLAFLRAHPRQGDASAPLFALQDGTPLHRTTVIKVTRALLAALEYNPAEYAGHSFRRGGATSLSAAGVADHLIQTMGRWASDCYRMYIDLPTEQLVAAGRGM